MQTKKQSLMNTNSAGIYLIKGSNGNIRTMASF